MSIVESRGFNYFYGMNAPIRIDLPTMFGMKSVNSYLFTGPEVTIVDCGEDTNANYQALEEGLRQQGLKVADIKRIVITHSHIDHIGMANRIVEASGARVYVPEYAYDWAVNLDEVRDERLNVIMDTLIEFGVTAESQMYKTFEMVFKGFGKNWTALPKEKVEAFPMNGTIELGGVNWEVIHVPGHCINQVSFYQPESRDYISADALIKITPTPVIDPQIDAPHKRNKGLQTMIKTLQKIGEMDIDWVHPGHYESFQNHKELVDHQLNRIQMRKNECYEWIGKGVNGIEALLKKMYGKRFPTVAFPMMVGYLDLLMDEGRINRVGGENGHVYFEQITA